MRKPTKRELAIREAARRRVRENRQKAKDLIASLSEMLLKSNGFSAHVSRPPILQGYSANDPEADSGFRNFVPGPVTTVTLDIHH